MTDSVDTVSSVKKYKRKKMKRQQSYRCIGIFFAVLDWFVFASIWLRNNVISTSVHAYASQAFNYDKGIFNPFFSCTYIFLGIYLFQVAFAYVDQDKRHWKSFITYLLPVLLGTGVAILFNSQFAYFISRMPKEYIDSVYVDFYSLFACLIGYGIIRVLVGFDYYISYYLDNYRPRFFVFSLYVLAYLFFLFASDWFPKLYPYL